MNRTPPPATKFMSPSKLSKFVKDTQFNGKGIAIIEPQETFGGGNLQHHYGIKSNTSASGFLKII